MIVAHDVLLHNLTHTLSECLLMCQLLRAYCPGLKAITSQQTKING